VSGNDLNIIANATVKITSDATKSTASPTTAAPPLQDESAARTALTTRETVSRKPIPRMPGNLELDHDAQARHEQQDDAGDGGEPPGLLRTGPGQHSLHRLAPGLTQQRAELSGEAAAASAPKNNPATLVTISSSGPIEITEQ
jgi:hypothetical protein